MTAPAALPAARLPLVLGGLGALAIGLSWIGSADSLRVGDQADWAIVGVTGTAAVVLASLLWILAARRAVELRLGHVLARLEPDTATPLDLTAQATAADELVAGPAMAHYHRPGCPLAAGKAVTSATRAGHETAGRRACGVCRP